MPRLSAANNAESILTNAVSESDTSITVDDASVFPVAPYRLTIEDEIIEVSAVSGNTLTVIRGMEETTAVSHNAGAKVENRMTAGTYKELVSEDELGAVDQKVDDVQQEFTSHKADYVQQMGTAELQTTDKTLKGAINEVFQTGNNVKREMVDALLSIDDSLPISYESSWTEIEVATGQISTGLKMEHGLVTSSSSSPYIVSVRGLSFRPSLIFVMYDGEKTSSNGHYANILFDDSKDHLFRIDTTLGPGRMIKRAVTQYLSGSSQGSLTVNYLTGDAILSDGFDTQISASHLILGNAQYKWVAVE